MQNKSGVAWDGTILHKYYVNVHLKSVQYSSFDNPRFLPSDHQHHLKCTAYHPKDNNQYNSHHVHAPPMYNVAMDYPIPKL